MPGAPASRVPSSVGAGNPRDATRTPAPPVTRVLLAGTLGCAAAASLAWIVERRLGHASMQPAVAAGVFASLMTVAAAAMRGHHPFPRFGPANRVTMVRGILLALVAGIVPARPSAAIGCLVVALAAAFAALDGLDGWLARRSGMASAFGARFDMELDALFILVLSLAVWQHGKAGPWILAAGLMRYGFVAAGRVLPWLARPLRSTRRGKAVAVAQMIGLAAAMAPFVRWPQSAWIAAAALAALTWSFAIDIKFLWDQQERDAR